MVGPAEGGFYGLNFHLIHPRDRAFLMEQLYKIAGRQINKNTKIRVTYEMLKGASNLKRFQPCFRHYLANHVVTPLGEIPTDDAKIAIHLPTEKFVYKSSRTIWSQNRKMY
jgi:hypothetical protein